ncbi:MAG: M28 family peptidase [Bacteroidota bacterium]|nr:M28 family peptidase [Bacteroidota bacterium]
MMNQHNLPVLLILLLVHSLTSSSQTTKNKTPGTEPPALSAIRAEDLRNDLFAMAGDHFRGREAGTLDELKVSMWWADRLRATGLKPAGDDGTYFQFFSMWRNRVSPNSSISIGGRSLQLWKDVLVAQTAPATVTVPVIFAGNATKAELDKANVKGKAVAVRVSPEGINLNVSLPERRYPGYVLRKYGSDLLERGAAAILFIADTMGERSWIQVVPAMSRGLYDIEGGPNASVTVKAPVIWLHADAQNWIKDGDTLNTVINVERFEYPSVNIVAKIEGTDPVLRKEYVLFSGHQDHDGVRQPYGTDSIYNGADDNASVSVALLAIARAFKKAPGLRSALFVWHGAEERGLLGSKWFSAYPTVPKESIVAVLNGDMIGRNNPDSAALLGVQPPHRNSVDLVSMALEANREGPRFKLDTLWDKVEHIEGWYFRSDHLPYARAGFPAIFYSTLLHADYHTPMDEPERIDIAKLKKMTEWMYRTGWKVANRKQRPALEANFALER